MPPNWFQQQVQRQQQQRQDMMGYDWMKKQQAAKGKGALPTSLPEMQTTDEFACVEAEVARLREALTARRLSQAQFRDKLNELMVQDVQGNWWMVGVETGGWFRYDGANWVPANPRAAGVRASYSGKGMTTVPPKGERHPIKALGTLIFGIGMAAFAAIFSAIAAIGVTGSEEAGFFIGFLVGIFVLNYCFREVGKAWRGET